MQSFHSILFTLFLNIVRSHFLRTKTTIPCDEQDLEWKTKFPSLIAKKSDGCVTSTSTSTSTSTKFKSAKGEGTVSPYGLGLGKTLRDAYAGANPFAQQELQTEDTEQGGKIFGASTGEPTSTDKGLMDGISSRSDAVSADGGGRFKNLFS